MHKNFILNTFTNCVSNIIDFTFNKKTLGRKFFFCLLVCELLISLLIVHFRKYTEIDWIAYMQEVEAYMNGEKNYTLIKGQTGPCVYPAGFVYLYSILNIVTSRGSNIYMAQNIFIAIYLFNLLVVVGIYKKISVVPPYAFALMCFTSYRVHSIYMLRLFNDPFAMLFAYLAVYLMMNNKFNSSFIVLSIALSIKMNVLLMVPGFIVSSLYFRGMWNTLGYLCDMMSVQLVLGAHFLAYYPMDYFVGAFNFARKFEFKWTVNWKFLSPELFSNSKFHVFLLFCHVSFLLICLMKFMIKVGIADFLNFERYQKVTKSSYHMILYPIFISNFIGIAFSRSLHYQFYVWYYHTIHYLLWCCNLYTRSVFIRVAVPIMIELCWNIYPATYWSSILLLICHLIILLGLTCTTKKDVYDKSTPSTVFHTKKKKN